MLLGRSLRRGVNWIPVKYGAVAAEGNLNADGQVGRSGVVILLQPAADFACLNANDGIVTGGVVGIAVEDLGADDALFQQLVVAVEVMADDVGEKLLAARAPAKRGAVQDFFQLAEDHRFGLGRFRG
jgi:hypothetical protein